jgi:hypothetical protein
MKKFPPIHGVAVYYGYRPTRQEIQTPAVDAHVTIRITQSSKWSYQAHFADSKPRQPVRSDYGEPIRGDIGVVMAELAKRFQCLILPFQWYMMDGRRAPYAPTTKPETKRPSKKKIKAAA